MLTLALSLLSLLPLTLSLPAPQNTVSIGPAGIATADTGISMTMYTKPSCAKNSEVQTVELQYYERVAQQFRSYKLNGTFTDQTVGIYKPGGANGDAVDGQAVGNVAIGCAEFVYNLADKMMTEGCHSFDTMMGCVEVQLS
ncbi:hypothetical protein JMJ35_009107 [Cladonia borealis]|uniref:Uncharacterized protein n=1 Tax=Cladonia borealis TaxID=184061 RepID=A0AA39QUT9_9LECA|nr:hypothetical protein JMJ35_009107 [Cladonia borealis]